MMHPYIQHQLTNIYVADMRSRAERQRVARAARRARRAPQRPAAQPVAGPGSVLHGLPALLTARGHRRQPDVLAAQAPQGLRA